MLEIIPDRVWTGGRGHAQISTAFSLLSTESTIFQLLSERTPPEDLREVFSQVARSLARSMERGGDKRPRKIRRHAAQMSRTLEDAAMLVDVTSLSSWADVRLVVESPDAVEAICLWIVAIAWRIVDLLDDDETELTEDQLDQLHELAIEGNATARALPTSYRMRAENLLREDCREAAKSPGPPLFVVQDHEGRECLHVRGEHDG